jgi:site-specific DNA-adenine methylase
MKTSNTKKLKDNKQLTTFPWMGGKAKFKSQMNEKLELLIKPYHDSYAEPFCGGLGAFISVHEQLIEKGIIKIRLSDSNHHVVNFYQEVQNNPTELIEIINDLEAHFRSTIPSDLIGQKLINKNNPNRPRMFNAQSFFKLIQSKHNKPTINASATENASHFFFMQQHLVNGFYRENKKGEQNTSFNWTPKTLSGKTITEKIKALHELFSLFDIEFSHKSYTDIDYNQRTVYYLDPPYVKSEISKTKEVLYTSEGFSIDDQLNLLKLVATKTFLYSNHECPLICDELIKIPRISILTLGRKNTVSGDIESRGNIVMEILASQHGFAPFEMEQQIAVDNPTQIILSQNIAVASKRKLPKAKKWKEFKRYEFNQILQKFYGQINIQ